MQWKVINNNSYELVSKDLLNVLLQNRKVTDIEALINVNKSNIHSWKQLKNIHKGITCLMKHINNKNHIHIIADSDCDGYMSFCYLYLYLFKNFNIKCTFHTHKQKEHGIIIEELTKLKYFDDIDLILSPDGGSFDYEAQLELQKLNKDIIVLDHHKLEDNEIFQENQTIVINPQLDDYPNKTLAGVGVVHKFCEGLDKQLNNNDSVNYLDLVAIGCIGDNMDLRNLETRYYVLQGIELLKKDKEKRELGINIKGNNFIQNIIKDKEENKLKEINIVNISWEIVPLFNAIARFGRQQEKIDVFKALINIDENRWYQPRRKHKEDPKPKKVLRKLQEDMVRVCKNAQSRQNNAKNKSIINLQKVIKKNKLNKNKLLIIDGTHELENKTLTGLIANDLAEQYKKPCIILMETEKDKNIYGGSMRNFDKSPIIDLQKFLINTNQFNYVRGHANASGININKNKISDLIKIINDQLKNIDMNDVYLVDYEIPIGRLQKNQITKVGKLADIWGNTLKKPLFAITNINMESKKINLIGKKGNVLKFNKNDITFIKFFANEELLNKMKMKQRKSFGKTPKFIKLDIIGEFHINKYEGKEYPQIHIIDFNVQKRDELLF